jgi:hypothetical protein
MKDLDNLNLSLDKITNGKPKHVIIAGDFNCPDIDWEDLMTSFLVGLLGCIPFSHDSVPQMMSAWCNLYMLLIQLFCLLRSYNQQSLSVSCFLVVFLVHWMM